MRRDWMEPRKFVPRSECFVATAIVGAGVVSAGASIFGANTAANAQEQAAQTATNAQLQMFHETQANLQPFVQGGQGAFNTLQGAIPGLTAPFNPTMQQLAQTPGYQFTKGQGLQATQNAFAAQGLGSSGAALKGAANYAEGLAGTTYQQQFQNNLSQNAQAYNMLYGPAQLGANAAANLGTNATQVGGQIGQNIVGAGNAAAGAAIASGNAVGNAFNSVPTAMMYNQLFNGGNAFGGYGGGGGGGAGFGGGFDTSFLG